MLKTLKRKIALVAVAGLGAGLISVAPANAVAITGSTLAIGPVRVSLLDTVLDLVPASPVVITLGTGGATYVLSATATATIDLVSAPAGAKMNIFMPSAGAASATVSTLTGGTTAIDGTAVAAGLRGLTLDNGTNVISTGGALIFGFGANKVGTYSGTISMAEAAGDGGDTIALTFTFTTTGAPTSWTLAGTSATSLISGTDIVTATLLDAAGKTTQPTTLDSLALTNTSATSFIETGGDTATTATELTKGTIGMTYTAGNAAGTNTVTVTPQGTLPGAGLAAKTLTYTVAGSVVNTSVTALTVSTPSTAVAGTGTLVLGTATATVAAGTSSLVMSFTHATPSAKVRLKVSGTAGTINGAVATTAQFFNVDADALGKGTLALTLAGSALIETTAVTVEQVDVANVAIDADGVAGAPVEPTDIIVTQTARAVAVGTIALSPTGNMIAKLGTATAPTATVVKVTVSDQFKGLIGAGYTVRAYRTAVDNANLLATGVTAADGTVSLIVTHATTLIAAGTETYVFQASAPGVTPVVATATTIINYTTDGTITGLSVAITGSTGGTTPLVAAVGTTVATSQTIYPALLVPADGFADDVAGDNIYTVSTAAVTGAATAEVVTLTTTTTPANSVSYSGSAGIKFLTAAPVATTTLWSAGTDTATVANATAIFVYGTKTGIGTVTITSGGLTRTVSIFIANVATNFHSIEVSAPTASIAGGAYATVTATVKDVFGNVVDTTGGALALTAEGAILLGGMSAASTTDTGSAGTAIITYLGNVAGGTGKITVANGLTTAGTAWAAGYVAPAGAAAPVLSVSTAVTVTATSATPENVKLGADVATANAAVKALATQVTVLQASVATLIDSLTTQIASLLQSVTALSKAVAKLQAKKK